MNELLRRSLSEVELSSFISFKQMNDPQLVKLISLHVDNATLRVLSQSNLWDIINPQLENQHFWYQRTQLLLTFPLEWDPKENWHQVYNIMSSLDKGNPFSENGALSLEENGYNLTAVKLLLRLKYDPSVDRSISLIYASQFGSSEVVKLLLDDPRVDPSRRDWHALTLASWLGRLGTLRILLDDPRTKRARESIRRTLNDAVRSKQIEVIKLLLERANITSGMIDEALDISTQEGSTDIVRLLLSDPRMKIRQGSVYSLSLAIRGGHADIVRLLLEEESQSISEDQMDSLLLDATNSGRRDISRMLLEAAHSRGLRVSRDSLINVLWARDLETVKYVLKYGELNGTPLDYISEVHSWEPEIIIPLLEDGIINPEAVDNSLLKKAINYRSVDVLTVLLKDPRVDRSGEVIGQALEHPENLGNWNVRTDMIEALIRSRNVDLSKIRSYAISLIRMYDSNNFSDAERGSSILSGSEETPRVMLRDCSSYNECHYEMLLRELILKRLDLEYYLEWILKQLKKKTTSSETRRLFSSVARSMLSSDSPKHTSDFFTAYRGFMLLAVSNDSRMIMNTLRSEGVTQEGLNLAGGLIGAFLGEDKLDEEDSE